MILSVIIPTHNHCSLLQAALNSLEMQTLPRSDFEILVIDNGSTDNTKEIVELAQHRLGNVRYFYEPTPGLHVGRHLGLKMAKSDILVYADDDIEAFPTWLEAIAESFQDSEVVLVGGKNLPKWESDPPDWILKMWEPDKNGNRILGYLSILDLGNKEKEISPFYVFGCNFSIRKRVLLEASGFHPDGMPKELIIYRGDGETHVSRYIQAKGYKAFYNPKASIYHVIPRERLTIEYFGYRAFIQGISDSFSDIRKKYKKDNYDNYETNTLALLKRCLRPLKRKINSLINPNAWQKDKLNTCLGQAWLKGYNFHQDAIRQNPELLKWVLRDDYRYYKLPGFKI